MSTFQNLWVAYPLQILPNEKCPSSGILSCDAESIFHCLPPDYISFLLNGSHAANWPYCSLTWAWYLNYKRFNTKDILSSTDGNIKPANCDWGSSRLWCCRITDRNIMLFQQCTYLNDCLIPVVEPKMLMYQQSMYWQHSVPAIAGWSYAS
jgi:hypothetical protein